MSASAENPYGFGDKTDPIKLPVGQGASKSKASKDEIEQAAAAGRELGFVSRQATSKRKPGPKRTEPQGKVTLTGPQRIIDRLQARCDALGGVPYWQAIEAMLDNTEEQG